MNRHQRTVVALSGTETDRELVQYARMVAGLGFARHYHFVHVRNPPPKGENPKSDQRVMQEIEDLLAEHFGLPRHDITTSCHILTGVRVDQLIDFISQSRSDLTLLGHRKSRSGQRSLARRLAMIAPCSVWMVPEGAPVSIRNIMVPIDFSDHSADSLQVATAIAKASQLKECLALHVFSDPTMIRYDEHGQEIQQKEQESFDQFVADLDLQGIHVEPTFVEGYNVAGTILHVAKNHEADLLVTNTRGRSRAASILLGSVTTQVMIESPIAVLAVKHYGAMMNLFQALQQSHFWMRRGPKTN